jgi:N-acetylglucosamine-6-phosphate deacetylase
MTEPLRITNARCYDRPGAGTVDITIRGGRITDVIPTRVVAGDGDAAGDVVIRIDAGGRTLIPGLIDVHVHGAGGGDIMDGSTDALRTTSQALARMGTTSWLGTGFMRPGGDNGHLRTAAAHVTVSGTTHSSTVGGGQLGGDRLGGGRLGGANLLGLHLEGPFVNPVRIGGLPPECMWPVTPQAVDDVLDATAGALRMMTIAPELDGGLDAVRRLVAAGVIASIGHTDATYEQARSAIDAGVTHATHLFNAMAPFHHRAPGPLVAIHEAQHVTVQLVSDDVHVGRHVVRWTQRIFGNERCVCITDGIRTAGLPDGRHVLGGLEYDSYDGAARYADGRLIGTSLPLLEIALRFREYTGCSLHDAIDAASLHPARVLGLDHRKGRIAEGYDADLVLLDGDARSGALRPWLTVVSGAVAFQGDA